MKKTLVAIVSLGAFLGAAGSAQANGLSALRFLFKPSVTAPRLAMSASRATGEYAHTLSRYHGFTTSSQLAAREEYLMLNSMKSPNLRLSIGDDVANRELEALYLRSVNENPLRIQKSLDDFQARAEQSVARAESTLSQSTRVTEAAQATEAAEAADPLFKFKVLNGKLQVGTIRTFKHLEVEGGEINLYGWGLGAGAAAMCGGYECLKDASETLLNDTTKLKDVLELMKRTRGKGAMAPAPAPTLPHPLM